MKKTVTFCLAAALTVSLSATAYAAPYSAGQTDKYEATYQNYSSLTQQLLQQLCIERLEKCLPMGTLEQLLPMLPFCPTDTPDTDTPVDKPDTDKPVDKPDTDKPVDTPDTDKPVDKPDTDKPVDKPSTEPGESVSSYAERVVTLVNAERAKAGLSALKFDAGASRAAQVRATEIRSSFSHTRPNGKSCFTALQEAGVSYRTAGENIASGIQTPEQVVNAWMNSEGHRKNILNPNFTAIGVAYLEGSYWAQFFIG